MRTAQWEYINSIIEPGLDNNHKKFYQYIKSQRQDNFGVGTLKADGKIGSTSLDKSNMLNNQFQSVFMKDTGDKPPKMTSDPSPTMPEIEITSEGFYKLLANLNPSKAAGPDKITARILRCVRKN